MCSPPYGAIVCTVSCILFAVIHANCYCTNSISFGSYLLFKLKLVSFERTICYLKTNLKKNVYIHFQILFILLHVLVQFHLIWMQFNDMQNILVTFLYIFNQAELFLCLLKKFWYASLLAWPFEATHCLKFLYKLATVLWVIWVWWTTLKSTVTWQVVPCL